MRWTEGQHPGLGRGSGSLGEVRVKLSLTPELHSAGLLGCRTYGRSTMCKVLAD